MEHELTTTTLELAEVASTRNDRETSTLGLDHDNDDDEEREDEEDDRKERHKNIVYIPLEGEK